jgi:ABC-type uncharacterized transport system ATPase subunit
MAGEGDGRIVVSGVSKFFRAVHAVEDLSFTVEPGAVTGFLGPNGAGKTTTMRVVALVLLGWGLLFASLGWVLTARRDIP